MSEECGGHLSVSYTYIFIFNICVLHTCWNDTSSPLDFSHTIFVYVGEPCELASFFIFFFFIKTRKNIEKKYLASKHRWRMVVCYLIMFFVVAYPTKIGINLKIICVGSDGHIFTLD